MTDAEKEKQTVKLYEKLGVYSQGGKLDSSNLLPTVIFGMKELKDKKLPGADKKAMLTQVIMTIAQEGKAAAEDITPEKVEAMIESLYIGLRESFKRTGCCR